MLGVFDELGLAAGCLNIQNVFFRAPPLKGTIASLSPSSHDTEQQPRFHPVNQLAQLVRTQELRASIQSHSRPSSKARRTLA